MFIIIVMSVAKYDSLTIHQNNGKKEKVIHEVDNDKNGQRESPRASRNKEEDMFEFTDEEGSVSWESIEEEEEDITKTDKQEAPQNKTDKKDKSHLRFVFFCILVILVVFPLFGLAIYLVQESRKVVKCYKCGVVF